MLIVGEQEEKDNTVICKETWWRGSRHDER